jgi:hypothetical protein
MTTSIFSSYWSFTTLVIRNYVSNSADAFSLYNLEKIDDRENKDVPFGVQVMECFLLPLKMPLKFKTL